MHKNQRCFILGTGSSINQQDISKLEGEICISISKFYLHPLFNTIKPRYHIFAPVLKYHSQYYDYDESVEFFRELEKNLLYEECILFFHKDDKKIVDEFNFFSKNKIQYYDIKYPNYKLKKDSILKFDSLYSINSISELAIQIALILNFDKIYMLGFDHDWFNQYDGKIFNYGHFYKENFNYSKEIYKHRLQYDAEDHMLSHAIIFNSYKTYYSIKKNIYNANANIKTYVDVFPRVIYDSLFEDKIQYLYDGYHSSFDSKLKYINHFFNANEEKSKQFFAKNLSTYYDFLLSLSKKNSKIVVYGNGNNAQFSKVVFKDSLLCIVDSYSKNFLKENKPLNKHTVYNFNILKFIEYDIVFISLFGREKIIIEQLEKLKIKKSKIITYEIS